MPTQSDPQKVRNAEQSLERDKVGVSSPLEDPSRDSTPKNDSPKNGDRESIPPAAAADLTLHVSGMKCAGCVKAVEKQLEQHPNVSSASVNLVTAKATVTCDVDAAELAHIGGDLAQRLTDVGFPTEADVPPSASQESTQTERQQPRLGLAERQREESRQAVQQLAIAISLLVLSLIGHLKHFGWVTIPVLSNIWFHFGLATLALVWPGRPILTDGWKGLRHGVPNMNTLVGLGMTASYTASLVALLLPQIGWECFFDEPVMLVGFILLGRTLEQRARIRATAAIESLFALQPETARLLPPDRISDLKDERSRNGHSPETLQDLSGITSVEIPTQEVQIGQWLRVLPGEKIPVDGCVIAGQTTVNEAMLTGESMPIAKQHGDTVSAGSLNQSGAIAIQATRIGKDTTLSQIIQLVESAQTRKAPVQRFADTVAGYFTYGVMAVATLTFIFWYFIGTQLWPDVLTTEAMVGMGQTLGNLPTTASVSSFSPLLLSLKLSIAVLVVACPCALGLATPTAILVGSGIGAERGLLIRGGDVLERVHRLDTLVFDKTGTLTQGQPVVSDVLSLKDSLDPNELIAIAASAEQGTQHPIALAIQEVATERSLALLPTRDVHTEAGYGITATVADQAVVVGTPAWLEQQQIIWDAAAQQTLESCQQSGAKTLVCIAQANELVGLLAVEDALREDATATVAQLQAMGLELRVLTGDRQVVAAAIAKQVGLSPDSFIADIRPEQKAKIIQQLQAEHRVVGMVGDGINDAPALAQANVGIALHSGTDVAIETSDIVLMRDRLTDVVQSIRLGRQVFNKIRQNLFWALAYNTLGIPVAAGVLLPAWDIMISPAAAGAFMAFSSVSVVTNALLLRRTFS